MNNVLVRRGPDDGGTFVCPAAGMAMRRLSIQDVSGGHQPIFNEDGSICVVFNGEIYNHLELRDALSRKGHNFRTRADTEVLVHLYEEYGDSLVDHLRGMFAFALLDKKKNRMLVARDRLGIKPLYYTQENGTFYFASEIKALREVVQSIGSLDLQALDAFFAYGYIPAPLTIYKEVKKLEPGCILDINESGVTRRQFWDLRFSDKEDLKEDEWIERVDSAIRSAVESHLISDVPVGAFLSGGVDSGLVSALAAPAMDYDLEAFTIGFEGRNSPLIDERKYARELADRYQIKYKECTVQPDFESIAMEVIDAFDEPFSDDSVIPSYYVSKVASQSVKVVLSGLGGDELFGGYQRYRGFFLSSLYQSIPGFVHRNIIDPLVQRIPEPRNGGDRIDHIKRFSAFAHLPAAQRYAGYITATGIDERRKLYGSEISEQVDFEQTEALVTDHFNRCDSDDMLDKVFYTDFKTYLPEDILALSDRISMWHSLEVRVPLVDHELVELAARMPARLKVGTREGKLVLKRLAERYIPKEMIYHRKQGFEAPMGAWLKDEMYDYANTLFNNQGAGDRLIDSGYLRNRLVEHRQGLRKNNKLLFSAIVLRLWADRFQWSL